MLAPAKLNDGRTVAHGFAFFTDSFNSHKMIQHFGSTVGGFGSIVRYYPQEKITIAVIGNLEDGGFGAEYIAKRVAGFYIPGAFTGSMKETPDAAPNQTQNHLQMLKDLADNKNPEMLAANYASRVPCNFSSTTCRKPQTNEVFRILRQRKNHRRPFYSRPDFD